MGGKEESYGTDLHPLDHHRRKGLLGLRKRDGGLDLDRLGSVGRLSGLEGL